MKKRFMRIIAAVITATVIFSMAGVFAIDYYVPEYAQRMTARFEIHGEAISETEFSMISEGGELVIHIRDNTLIYFEDFIMARDVLEGQTLAELLNGRKLVVTYAIVSDSLPQQTSPISIKVLYEEIMPFDNTPELFADRIPFEDVQVYDWFYNSVVWAFENEIMSGISVTEFAPDAQMTRAMLVTVLWRYANRPNAGKATFNDVAADTWYSEAVAWAAENGIVMGYDSYTFGVNDYITREQMHTILYRYMNFAELTIMIDEEASVQRFADEDEISDWASDALRFMHNAGIVFMLSTTDRYIRPQDYAIRGEIAAAMYFFDMYAISAVDYLK